MNRRLVRRRISTLALAFLLSGPAVAAADDLLDRRITLDLEGFRSGSLNEDLNDE